MSAPNLWNRFPVNKALLQTLQTHNNMSRCFSSESITKKRMSGLTVEGTMNISHSIMELRKRKLHQSSNNPIGIVKSMIESHFDTEYGDNTFVKADSLNEVVNVTANFDDLLIPTDHPSREFTDTYYFDENTLLRPQTSAHQTEMLRAGHRAFLCSGDCYRKDTIDKTHYPVFHQMEGVRIWRKSEISAADVENDLKQTLEKLVGYLFPNREFRWLDDYFPFTDPSFEMEVKMDDNWLEIFGSGVIHTKVLEKCNLHNDFHGWAFGLGLERLAMPLFDISDIRQFWSTDARFLNQFSDGKVKKFENYSKYPMCYKDISFWIDEALFHTHELMDIIRCSAGDLVEGVELIDEFTHPKTQRISHCYRIAYRHNDRTLTNEEVNDVQNNIRDLIEEELNVEIRG